MADRVVLAQVEQDAEPVGCLMVDADQLRAMTRALRLAEKALDELERGAVPHQVAGSTLRRLHTLVDFTVPAEPRSEKEGESNG